MSTTSLPTETREERSPTVRRFKIQIVDDKDEVVVEYPFPTNVIHNGLGGGTDTPTFTEEEKKSVVQQLTTLSVELRKVKPKKTDSEDDVTEEKPDLPASESLKCELCDYATSSYSPKLREANMKLHQKYKHEGKIVGKQN